ncbi:MAG: SAM-dependent methyltransferase [Proteobacteria bacterium]|nr:MAG: SAM-dependent methyltransferase [Pseudomonadota bacterium]
MSDPELRAHREWLGFLQPTGLLVSAHALAASGVAPDRNIAPQQQILRELVDDDGRLRDFAELCTALFGWEPADLAPGDAFEVALPEYGDRLAPRFAVFDPDAPAGASAAERALLLIHLLEGDADFDAPSTERGWQASPQARFERLLRETGVAHGLIANDRALRLVYAPRGESSGFGTFRWSELVTVAGRPLVSALHMLLRAERLFTSPAKQRLPALLRESRRFQSQVSTRLAEQVLGALWDLLGGFQAADAAAQGRLLGPVVATQPREVYGGLLSTLLRLVFVLYAEDRGLLSNDPVYVQHYSVGALFEKLRDDAGRHPDTMDQRYGAWARLLALFRLIFAGAGHGALRLPARRGQLFDPDAYPFLEGRAAGTRWDESGTLDVPRVPDGVVWRVLSKLLVLDGERLSYRALDVEQIGSVYEAMMGFRLERAAGAAIGVRPKQVVVDVDALLIVKPKERAKQLQERAECKLEGRAAEALRAAKTPEDVAAALGRRLSPYTPRVLPPGGLYLQPTEERRRSGSHYTPRSLTEPIVATTLRPILDALGPRPTAEQILALRVCDPAMGSGAFLVEACRSLGDALVAAWQTQAAPPEIPPDEDPQLFARRLVAQQCLYGVDKNPFAVDLAKLSLWLATLAKEHPFTFLDHALRCGDSLVGLSRRQIAGFHWEPEAQVGSVEKMLAPKIAAAERLREEIQSLAESDDTAQKAKLLAEADATIADVRLAGDLVVAAFFEGDRPRERLRLRATLEREMDVWLSGGGDRAALEARGAELHRGEHPIPPFHWEIEFPEVFSRESPGFDAFVGNPPFAGKNTITAGNREHYLPWLQALHDESHGNSDLVAHFYRRAFDLLRKDGAFGLIATNTIAQGDTRHTGLRWICTHGGTIYAARKRVKWPGMAAVVVSVVHVAKGEGPERRTIDGRPAEQITAFLFHEGGHESPAALAANASKSFIGSYVLGMGFTFDDDSPDATPLAEMERLLAKDPRNRERIFPYIGGEELNDSPTHAHRRYVINFGEMTEAEARRWPDLMAIVDERVKPDRLEDNRAAYRTRWWQYAEKRSELFAAIRGLDRVLVVGRNADRMGFAFLPVGTVYSEQLVVFASSSAAAFCALQSRPHEVWARFFSGSMKDDLRYSPSDCFETLPLPVDWDSNAVLEAAGRAYYEHRAALMIENGEGLTKTYNRFHDPDEGSPGIVRLRALHDAMDRAVLDAYGWTTLRPEPKFLLDYEEEDDGADDESTRRRRKKPWRLRWPDETRDDVLARLLALNRERAAEEARSGGVNAKSNAKPARGRKRRGTSSSGSHGPLFD